MAEITASLVKELREMTDAPMMDCKKALSEVDGDLQKAEELLRVKFGNKASKVSSRVAAEGLISIAISSDGKQGAILETNSETDFCAKNDEFVSFTQKIANAILDSKPSDIEALKSVLIDGTSVEETRSNLVGKIGENISPRRFVTGTSSGKYHSYLHGGKIGVLLDLDGGDDDLGKDIAMHIAASKPKALDESGISQDLIDAEKRVAIEKAKEAGKPEEMLDKIATGTVNKFLKEVTLLNQAFVKDDKQTIQNLLDSKGAKIHSFTLFVVGEGIEKVESDFAAEVAEASKI
ncbi:MAG: elongation factor Ts [Betaproteobacteria bacterium]|jgi:elongation factor Ts|nr:elongation factor Ts [Betaproteobacteria bacterium]